MIRRALLLLVLALLVLFVVADRLTEQATAHALSVRARQAGLLAADPHVTIGGFPFLTQAARSRFEQVDVTTHGIRRGGLRIETVVGRFRGVHVGLAAALDGRVGGVAVDAGRGEVEVTYADLDALLVKRRLTVTASGPLVRVAGMATVAGRRVRVSGSATVAFAGGALSLTPVVATLRGPAGPLTAATAATAATSLTVRVTVADLPFGVAPTAVVVGPRSLRATGSAVGPAVPVPADASRP